MTVVVIKDCTGSYFRYNDKDYQICNSEIVTDFPNGAAVKASFMKVLSCPDHENRPVCKMYHLNEGWIYVTSITTIPEI